MHVLYSFFSITSEIVGNNNRLKLEKMMINIHRRLAAFSLLLQRTPSCQSFKTYVDIDIKVKKSTEITRFELNRKPDNDPLIRISDNLLHNFFPIGK